MGSHICLVQHGSVTAVFSFLSLDGNFRATWFEIDWISYPEFEDWIRELPDDVYMAKCIKCQYVLILSNMGQRTLKSDTGGGEHKKKG